MTNKGERDQASLPKWYALQRHVAEVYAKPHTLRPLAGVAEGRISDYEAKNLNLLSMTPRTLTLLQETEEEKKKPPKSRLELMKEVLAEAPLSEQIRIHSLIDADAQENPREAPETINCPVSKTSWMPKKWLPKWHQCPFQNYSPRHSASQALNEFLYRNMII